MAPSQLKRLKASIHEERTSKQNPRSKATQRHPARDGTLRSSIKETSQQRANRLRQEKLLPELQRRHKVGGVIDRRIGENDPTLAPEDRMLQRYAAETQRSKRASIFNLEDDLDAEDQTLTHFGKPVNGASAVGGDQLKDDFDDSDGSPRHGSDQETENILRQRRKRRLEDAIDEYTKSQQGAPGEPTRKKSKKEVMEEVVAKSKFHKHERQQEKDDDQDIREQLDKELPNLLAALTSGAKRQPDPRAATKRNIEPRSNGAVINADAEYDRRIRQMAQDQRAQPTQRTKTAEEKAEEEARRLKELEEDRQRRMLGEEINDNKDENSESDEGPEEKVPQDEIDLDEAADFGLKPSLSSKKPQEIEDEDVFIVDDNLVASDSEIDSNVSLEEDDAEMQSKDAGADGDDDEDADFLQEVLPKGQTVTDVDVNPGIGGTSNQPLAFTFPCPQSHPDLLKILESVQYQDQPTVIQRIRALYHPQLSPVNKTRVQDFSVVLVDHIAYMAAQRPPPALSVIETIIRHIHSIARSYPTPIAEAFRRHLSRMQHAQSSSSNAATEKIQPGDLTILTAISTIYPTSDHFHGVVTPAMTIMAWWLGTTTFPPPSSSPPSPQHRKAVTTLSRTGAYLTALCARYQRLSHRYIPETICFTLSALTDPVIASTDSPDVLIAQHLTNISTLSTLWSDKSAFQEIFSPAIYQTLHRLSHPQNPCNQAIAKLAKPLHIRLTHQLQDSQLHRRPLLLHNHPALPIPTKLPKLEADYSTSSFHPSRHNDPDSARADAARLRKEFKKEKKGALRELRKDSEFIAREKLKEKRERDRGYEEKVRRLVASVQTEEGGEGARYEREKRRRSGRF